MAWNDKVFRDRITHRALEIRKSQAQILSEAGLSKGWLSAGNGRTISTMERIMEPLGWTPRDLFQAMSAALGWDFDESKGVWISNKEIDQLVAAFVKKAEQLNQDVAEEKLKNAALAYQLSVANATLEYLKDHGPEDVSVFAARGYSISSLPGSAHLQGQSVFGADATVKRGNGVAEPDGSPDDDEPIRQEVANLMRDP
jgi:hypothetical protein